MSLTRGDPRGRQRAGCDDEGECHAGEGGIHARVRQKPGGRLERAAPGGPAFPLTRTSRLQAVDRTSPWP